MLEPPHHLSSVLTGVVRRFTRDGQSVTVRLETGGHLVLPSGSVVAMEPFHGGSDVDEQAFTCALPRPGICSVTLVIAEFRAHGHSPADPVAEMVAAAVLVVDNTPVASWEMALWPGQDGTRLGEDGYFGYPVDGGVGCFTDAQALVSMADDAALQEELDNIRMDVADRPLSPHFLVNADDEPVLVAFATGGGDGLYPTWIGRTANGGVACFVTDFFVLGDATPLHAEPTSTP